MDKETIMMRVAGSILCKRISNKKMENWDHIASCSICDDIFKNDGIFCKNCCRGYCDTCYVSGDDPLSKLPMGKMKKLKRVCRNCANRSYDNKNFLCVCCNTHKSDFMYLRCENHGRICGDCIYLCASAQGGPRVCVCKKCKPSYIFKSAGVLPLL